MFHHDTFKLQNHKKGFLISHLNSYFKNRNWTCVVSTQHTYVVNKLYKCCKGSLTLNFMLASWYMIWLRASLMTFQVIWVRENKSKLEHENPTVPHLIVWLSCRFHCVTGQIIKSHDVPQHADCLVKRTISTNISSETFQSQSPPPLTCRKNCNRSAAGNHP